jgi:predicted AAA+ superfamily ATPase
MSFKRAERKEYLDKLSAFKDKDLIKKVDDLEVNFVAMEGSEITYFQVCATVQDAKILRKELTPLQKINDHYRKIILTLDEDPRQIIKVFDV